MLFYVQIYAYTPDTKIRKTKELTMNVGGSISLTPINDMGVDKTTVYIWFIYAKKDLPHYSISDPSSFTFSYKQYENTVIAGGFCYYYRYSLKANKRGVYTFTDSVCYIPKNQNLDYIATITYTIKVVDVVSISIPERYSLSVGSTYTFTPIILDQNATTTLTWSSSDTSVATIEDGIMNATGVGTTTITCIASNGVSAQCNVTVTPIQAESITMNTSSMEITEGERSQLNVSFTPENVTSKNLLWQSDNESVAIVDQTGRVTGIAAGTCNITATTQDGSNKVANCEVRVISDYIYCGKTIAVAGSNGTLAVSLKNSTELTAMQFELDLPDGVTVSEAALTSRKNGHSIDYALLGNGNYQFTVFSSSSKPFIGNDGVMMNVVLSMPAEMAAGDYTLWQKNIELTTTTGHAVYIEDRSSTLTVNDALLGDVNGDTKISITDAVGIVNYILGNVSASFLPEAADVNCDGNITITDAVAVVNIILNQSATVKERRTQENVTEREPQ